VSRQAPAATDRGMWLVVARRDFGVRLKDRGFVVSTAITLTVLSVFILLRAYGGGGTNSYDLGVVGSEAVANAVVLVGRQQGVEVRPHAYQDVATARIALGAGQVDAVLEPASGTGSAALRLVGSHAVPSQLQELVQAAAVAGRIRSALADSGMTADQLAAILDPSPVVVQTLHPPDPDRDTNAAVAFVGVLLLYGQLFGYGVWVSTGVIEEKASRVVEILLSAIRPRQLLAGKVAGIGALGLAQLAFIATFALLLAKATGALELPVTALRAAALVLVWFVMGFAFYAGLFAVSGALVSRMEELQNAMVPINLVILASFFISIGALQHPDAPLSVVASIVPFSAPLAMPVRIILGSATAWQVVLAVVLLLGCAAAMIPLAGRLYAGAVLRTGAKVRLRDAWRAAA
jgi:ABC-2 type transport system permease protein